MIVVVFLVLFKIFLEVLIGALFLGAILLLVFVVYQLVAAVFDL